VTLSINDALARLRAKTFDPGEFVMVGDRKRRVVNAWETSSKKVSDRKYIAKNQQKHADYQRNYSLENPERIDTQQLRQGDRAYHRPFTAVDFEGQSFKEHDEVDAKGNVSPLHRVILGGARGWVRNHSSTDLSKGIGNPRDGKATEPHWLYHEDRSPLSGVEIRSGFCPCRKLMDGSRKASISLASRSTMT
jgi:hypothetical protein